MKPTADPKTVVILGVPFHDVTMAETLACLDELVARQTPCYLATANLDFAAQASRDVELQRILLEAELVLCDGTPLIWASRWLGAPLRERVAGSDLMPVLAAHAARQGYRLFLLGADNVTLATAKQRLESDNPGLQICGTFSPPVARLLDLDHDDILRRIHEAQPHILLVAFGCPKQEKWIYMNLPRLRVPVSVGVGGTFDMVAGNVRRAPVWMRKSGVEWIFRLIQEPRRLFSRYMFDLWFFVHALRRQRRVLTRAPGATVAAVSTEARDAHDFRCVVWSGRIDAAAVEGATVPAPLPDDSFRTVFVDCSGVTFLDSTGLGLLLRGYRMCLRAGGAFALVNPADAVTTLLAAAKLDRLLISAPTIAQARAACGLVHTGDRGGENPDDCVLAFEGDVTAARAPALARWIDERWQAQPAARRLVLDLTRVGFLDSSGLGLLVRARKLALSRSDAAFTLRGANANVRNVIALARLGAVLGLEPVA